MATIRLTAAQALVRYLAAQRGELDGAEVALFAGVLAIFGHGNVAALGEALYAAREVLPTFRAHNEQAMAPRRDRLRQGQPTAADDGLHQFDRAGGEQHGHRGRRWRMSIGCRCCSCRATCSQRAARIRCCSNWRISATRTVSVNDCFRPVSRYFDRITRPQQLLTALPRAMAVLTDPAECGPVTLALCQDMQAEAFDWPEAFFAPRVWRSASVATDAR